jgi:hypothetical protein
MNDTGISWGWFGAYLLGGLAGLVGGMALDKFLAWSLKQSRLAKTFWAKINGASTEEEFDPVKDALRKNNFKLSHDELRRQVRLQNKDLKDHAPRIGQTRV